MDRDFKTTTPAYTFQSSSDTLLSIHLLDFKTSLLEAVEELRVRRDAEINYEDQINKIIMEKQELEWQKETLQHETETLNKQHKEAMAAFKKQLQARMFTMEEEKGKYQLAIETKEKEIDGLKKTLKTLQISKYTLQKKLNEMDQKLQLHIMAKEEHHKKLNEVEKCYATITCQFGMIKGAHEKLEQNVLEALQLNKKLASVNKRQESEIDNLKEELKKVTTDLIRSKVTCQYRVGEENINLTAKEQQLQELLQKIRMETEINKKLSEENAHVKEEKQEIISSLQHMQQLLQRLTQTNVRMENELNALKEEYQTLERDNELQREKAKENEEKFLNLQKEHEKALRTWKKDEEDLRIEMDAIKNVSLKEAYGHLQDSHLPQKNQHTEQEENLQTSPKENTYTQSTIKNDSISGPGQEDDIEVKNIIGCSSDIDKVQTEQSNGSGCTEETYNIVAKDLQLLENYKDEVNVASHCEEKQREASPGKTLCTDIDLITQGQASEVCVAECKKTANIGKTDKTFLEKNNASAELKPQDRSCALAKLPENTRKMLLDNTEEFGVCSMDAGQQTDSSKHIFGNASNELVYNTNDKADATQDDKGVFINEAPSKESRQVIGIEDSPVTERTADNHQTIAEFNFAILSQVTESSHTKFQKCHLQESNDIDLDNEQDKTEPLHLLNRSTSGISSDIFKFKQIHTDIQEKHNSDTASTTNGNCALNSTCDTASDAPVLPTSFCDNVSMNRDNTKENNTNMSLLENFNVSTEKTDTWTKLNDMHSNQSEEDISEQTETDTNTYACTDVVLPLNTENICASQTIIHKQMVINKITTDKQMPWEKVHANDFQIPKMKDGQSLVINDNALENTLLRAKKESLNSTVPGEKIAEGRLEESCSLLIRTSGDLVNRSGRSSFDLSTSDKKTEKTPVYLSFSDLSPWLRVNQVESQTAWASTSEGPFHLKEKLLCISENKKILSKAQCQNLSINAVMKETGLDSTSINRVADTLNTSSIHRGPKRDPSEEWNAIAKTFYDSSFPSEHVKAGITVSCHQQKLSHLASNADTPISSESLLSKEEQNCDAHNFFIKSQISDTEKFLNLERLHRSRKRKYEESLEKAAVGDKTEK
ncbi:coiled-coil domain-containing protein 73 isoform X1 [Mauremys reevesii]|uniref:coiled-coil domain-containing protein 73 isoform X1 n=3 Tax=Mauremys reevesii TaxID=260615 RepID=UPI00193EF36E|nr:coiled-coil domain-containing protein 73 isoform X1 [Mauremys reevesii]XP_039392266.1 coiled-coil domain-containing protein 73 isoform X1 [Mauremys reevesii]XP_039392267.1 coiled-coil domain-containing protein 73 isoform X1 [Mauremys reevesii]XP_039392268.1 coiled-coil domain-containing protein 73 isoform X1 [Mauremys reevesii]XP_039392269.1 coiled-coil domain-containing protein 73 isoform X1 [Mauremys reevesii]XP_039392270.1 coiled-coil domain-containing protein 73 isoform X1 [Mauremys ree